VNRNLLPTIVDPATTRERDGDVTAELLSIASANAAAPKVTRPFFFFYIIYIALSIASINTIMLMQPVGI
jgi:hypothetical protein